MRKIVWQVPDGTIQVTTFVTDDPAKQQEAIDKLFRDGHLPAGTAVVADGPEEQINRLIPADRAERARLRWRNGRGVIDPVSE